MNCLASAPSGTINVARSAVDHTQWTREQRRIYWSKEFTMTRMVARLVGAMLAAAAFVAAPSARAAEVNFITDFGYYGRHSYYYVAFDKGYYKQEGIDLNFLRGQGSIDAIKKVAS